VPTAGAQQDSGVAAVPVNNAWSVSIGDNFFDPADVAVEPGDTITWTNEGAVPHTVTADDGSFDSETLNPGESYTVTFSGEGTLTYHCELHPEMVGSVSVGGAVGGGEPAPAEQQYSTEDNSGGMDTPSGY
jgi:plastocyanin